MASKLCDSCKLSTATLFCRADSAFLCANCDTKIHAANKLASRHPRVWVCEVCEQAPAHVTCKADAAALCVTCDRDIHSANPLSRRHERVPITPFYHSAIEHNNSNNNNNGGRAVVNFLEEDRYFDDVDGGGGGGEVSREEAEAASWLLPNPKVVAVDLNTGEAQEDPYVFSDLDPYLDLDYVHVDPKLEEVAQEEQNDSSVADGVVPVQSKNLNNVNVKANANRHHSVNDACFDLDFSGYYGYGYNNTHTQRLSNSVSSSSSLDVGVVPDDGGGGNQTVQISSSAEREARVLRYREKRKNRKFEKTIRYASRKAYAEMRPRIKGRFVKRTDTDAEAAADDRRSSSCCSSGGGGGSIIYGFGVVPSL